MLGSEARLLLGLGPDPEGDLRSALHFLQDFQGHLSRFDPESELSLLNQSKEEEVPVSPLLHRAIREALRTAERSGGIIDPTVLRDLHQGGYRESWRGEPLPIEKVLRLLPEERLAEPSGRWREIELGDGFVRRPPGLEIDLGGVGKGMAADDIAEKFSPYTSWCVDLGGDLRFGGRGKRTVRIPSPFGEGQEVSFGSQAVATSGVWRRIWLRSGELWHHLLDPASGQPVWSQYAQVTAFAPTVREAERMSKEALLRGDPRFLEKGGLLLRWSGEWEYA